MAKKSVNYEVTGTVSVPMVNEKGEMNLEDKAAGKLTVENGKATPQQVPVKNEPTQEGPVKD